MSKPESNTASQLRKLIQSHITTTAAKPEPVPAKPATPPPAASPATPVSPVASSSTATVAAARPYTAPPSPRTADRYSVKLLVSEIAKINAVIQNTMAQTGERVTLSDVLRTGIMRLADSSVITRTEVIHLRNQDGRRHKSNGGTHAGSL